jgi:dTDP-4-amino-4,6-dideoxygalactose transaminase
MIQVYSNSLGDDELEAIRGVFASKWLGMGKECQAMEKELGDLWGTRQVLLMNNCSAALFVSLKALGVGPGDEVIIATVNFLACVNAVLDVGAIPVFADVDPATLNILPEEIVRLRTAKTRAVFILHYGGHPADFDRIREACGPGVAIIEDSANSVASTYKGKACGTLGDAGTFSFDAMKTLVMGDGGALIVRDEEVFRRAKSLRYLGFKDKTTSGVDSLREGQSRWWEFDLDLPSGRFISNDMLAAVGRVQLRKLAGFIARRKEVWTRYQTELAGLPGLSLPPEPLPGCTGSYYIYWIRLEKNRDELARFLADQGVYSTFRYFPLHLVRRYGSSARLPNSETISETTLNLPLHQNLSDSDVDQVVAAVKRFLARA